MTATMDLDMITSFRASIVSRSIQSASEPSYPRVHVDYSLTKLKISQIELSPVINPNYYCVEEEIMLGPACWLWDYMRRSKSKGFFLPLSGGIDSGSVALIVFCMCRLLFDAVKNGDRDVSAELKQVIGTDVLPNSAQEICK